MKITIIVSILAAALISVTYLAESHESNIQLSDVMNLPREEQGTFFDRYFLDHYWSYHGFTLYHNKAVGWWAGIGNRGFQVAPVASASLLVALVAFAFHRRYMRES